MGREMLIHRTRQVAAHWQLLAYFREQIPLRVRVFGSGIQWVCNHLEHLLATSASAGIKMENLPQINLETFRERLSEMEISDLNWKDPKIMRTLRQLPDQIQETSMSDEPSPSLVAVD